MREEFVRKRTRQDRKIPAPILSGLKIKSFLIILALVHN